LACLDLSTSLRWWFGGIAVVNLVSATQDVATDGLAVQLLGPRERGLGNGIQVGAYRIGMIVGGGALLWLFALAGWRVLFVAMAALLLLTALPVLLLPQTATRGTSEPAPTRSVALAAGWWRRLRRPGMRGFIVLIGAFMFGDSVGPAMLCPWVSASWLSVG